MKRLLMISALVPASVLLAGCDKAPRLERNNNNKQQQEGPVKMVRVKTASGLEYEILTEGSGISPQKGKHVTVHYTGWLDNNDQPGAKFDSSVDRGTPFTFIIGVGQVIKGWDEGVLGMKIGEKRRLMIPSSLGYGAHGAGRAIPPHANLIFDVELISIA